MFFSVVRLSAHEKKDGTVIFHLFIIYIQNNSSEYICIYFKEEKSPIQGERVKIFLPRKEWKLK